jgi:hypothetical protein
MRRVPGATGTEFSQRDTQFGDNSWKNRRELAARKGHEALMAGREYVIGRDRPTWRAVVIDKFLPSTSRRTARAR